MRIDLNADLGEGVTDDEGLLGVVTSANLACGFHAGDEATMRAVCTAAARTGVVVGAQVSYDDREHFGRRHLDVEPEVLTGWVDEQVRLLTRIAVECGTEVAYLKPHGALYNRVVDDEEQAVAVAEAVRRYDPSMPLLTLPGSALATAADEAGLPVVGEGFADRAYTARGRLASRREPGSVISAEREVTARAVRMAGGTVTALSGEELSVSLRSICVHSDTPGAAGLARAVRSALEAEGWTIASFATP
jgi:UPF0271 protein